MPIREISHRTELSHNTIRNFLVTDIVESQYPKRKSPSKPGDYEHTLTNWLFHKTKRHCKYRRRVLSFDGKNPPRITIKLEWAEVNFSWLKRISELYHASHRGG